MKTQKKNAIKEKFAASHEIINRILWDQRLNPRSFVIGFQDRVSKTGLREKPLLEWDENGEIPWHRIRYIRCEEIHVWDREERINLFSTDQLPESAWQTEGNKQPLEAHGIFTPKTVYKYNGSSWIATTPEIKTRDADHLAIASYNVLTNRFADTDTQLAKRIPAIVELLKSMQAQIICLQEVTTELLQHLLAQEWMYRWHVSDTAQTLNVEKGLVLLSQFPFALVEHSFSPQKNCLVGSFAFEKSEIHVAVVHLTSNRAENASQIRQKQLQQVANYLHSLSGTQLIAGDFNMREPESMDALKIHQWTDSWPQLHPQKEGYTFDPSANPLAAANTLTGLPGRLDRILVRNGNSRWKPQQMQLFGKEPIDDTDGKIYPSDHFGICLQLVQQQENTELQSLKPTYQSALVVIPPENCWAPIQAIRQKYDSKVDRWMPHITLVYGFIADEHFGEAAQLIGESLKKQQPFEVTLSGFSTFEHRSSTTAWLKPETADSIAWQRVQQVLQDLFPQCNEQSSRAGGFTPHLSVGQFTDQQTAKSLLPHWQPVSFEVDKVALISRHGDEPFAIRYTVELATGKIELIDNSNLVAYVNHHVPELTVQQCEQQETVLGLINQACEEVLGQPGNLNLLGSARLGTQTAQSDTDAVCLIPKGLNQAFFLQNVKEQLNGIYQKARLVTDVQIPALRLEIEGQSVDLLCANSPFFPAGLEAITPSEVHEFDALSWQTLSGCLEAEQIIRIANDTVGLDSFRWLVRAVRLWAKRRKIAGNGWGYLGSFSWTVLAAWGCQSLPKKDKSYSKEELMRHFFESVSRHNWQLPISLTDEGKRYQIRPKRDWMPVVTSVKPCFNSARNVTRSTFQVMKAELKRANTAMQTNGITVFEEQSLPVNQLIQLQAVCRNEEELAEVKGWLEGNVVGLLLALENAGVSVRPYPGFSQNGFTATLSIRWELLSSLETDSRQQALADFIQRFDSWAQRPSQSQLTYKWVDRPI